MTKFCDRLREARIAAGYADATAAAAAFGWKYPTYAGHENGSRGARADAIQRYARAFGVDPSWLQFGTGRGPENRRQKSARRQDHLSEPAAEPFVGRSSRETSDLERLALSLAPNTNAPALYVSSTTFLDLGIFVADILLLDLKPAEIDGKIVLLNVTDADGTDATTAFARSTGGVLSYSVAEPRPLPKPTLGQNSAVLGLVAAIMRRC